MPNCFEKIRKESFIRACVSALHAMIDVLNEINSIEVSSIGGVSVGSVTKKEP